MDDANNPFISLKDALKDEKRIKYHNDYLESLLASIKYATFYLYSSINSFRFSSFECLTKLFKSVFRFWCSGNCAILLARFLFLILGLTSKAV